MKLEKKIFFETLEKISSKHGIVFFGISGLDTSSDFIRYKKWLAEGKHAGMKYLEENLNLRKDPTQLLPGSKTALVFGLNYNQGDRWQRGRKLDSPRFAMYSRLRDYHKVLRERLTLVQNELICAFSKLEGHKFRVVVDSAPILERTLAFQTKSGFIGKNTCFIHPQLGSFFLLAELITTFEFQFVDNIPNQSKALPRSDSGGCGTCKRCQVQCPTGALRTDYQIDANKCLSWWTIENRGPIPREYWRWLESYIFGCDICQLVCPWNRNLKPISHDHSLIKLNSKFDLFTIATMNQTTYESLFAGTPATRAKREGLMRNALIALYIKQDPRLPEAISIVASESHEALKVTISMIQSELGQK